MTTYGSAGYRRVGIETATPGELVIQLYARALNDLAQGRAAIDADDPVRRHRALTHCHEIICALQRGLDMEAGGALAIELNRLYTYIRPRILDANIRKDAGLIDEVEQILQPLHLAWVNAVQEQSAKQAPVTVPMAPMAPLTRAARFAAAG